MEVFCIHSIPLSYFLGGRPISSLNIQLEFDETSMTPIFYQGEDDYPSSVQVCKVSDSHTKMDAILAYDVAVKYLAGEDITQRPLFYNEEIRFEEVVPGKYAQTKRIHWLSYENENSRIDSSKDNYPYYLLPDALQDAVDGRVPRKPNEPHPPQKPEGRPINDSIWPLLFWGPLVVVSTILIVLSIAIGFYGGIIWALIIGVVVGLVSREKLVSKYDLVSSSEMDQRGKKYTSAFEAYKRNLKEYQEELRVYEDRVSRYKEYSRSDYIRYLLGICLNEYTPPTVESNLMAIKQGPGERFLYQYLKRAMSDNFEFLESIRTKHCFYNGGETYYYPDIALRHKETGLMIDIEVDEPYIAKTGEPIHCEAQDKDRNKAFVLDNWIVFRFTEEQAIRFPEICLAYIRTVCSSLLNLSGCETPITWRFDQKQWGSFEASEMARSNYRLTYLPKETHSSVYVSPVKAFTDQIDENEDLPF